MQGRLIWLASLILLAVFGAWFYLTHERVEEEVWLGLSREAKRNPYLATERYLDARNVDVIRGATEADFKSIPTGAVVMISHADNMLVSASKINAALEWVADGGTLVVGAGMEVQGHDSVFTRFGIVPHAHISEFAAAIKDEVEKELSTSERMREANRQLEEQKAREKAQGLDADGSESPDSGDAPNESQDEVLEDDDSSEELDEFSSIFIDALNQKHRHSYFSTDLFTDDALIYMAKVDRFVLLHPWISSDEEIDNADVMDTEQWSAATSSDIDSEPWSVRDQYGPRLLDFDYGEGRFVAVSSTDYWNNGHVGEADHAFLLSQLVPDGSSLYLFYDVDAESLWGLIYRYFFEFLLVAAVILGLWLWRRGIRTQMLRRVASHQRRNFAEHLEASTRYLVNKQQWAPLINSLRDDVDARLRLVAPGFRELSTPEQVDLLVELAGVGREQAEYWLGPAQDINDQYELFNALKVGNLIRKKL
ncbi:hypothetical protein GCM10008090_08730 [Arenicella chitinivorans]|uniref:DUF4350 domain-containing protein n=1 Tax=Arenicella chitinivorans TaxID=1329800 RepID=A0A918RM65_9GAMM|nr:DUF4350 domain-containing protein [Arenicella chitinivorans]GHA01797.1 hypothetical protein GCM10008090_08730 [Arenicella chitinivorans]